MLVFRCLMFVAHRQISNHESQASNPEIQKLKFMKSYTDLDVWKKSRELVKDIYLLTQSFPKDELYGLSSQVKRFVLFRYLQILPKVTAEIIQKILYSFSISNVALYMNLRHNYIYVLTWNLLQSQILIKTLR